MLHINDDSNELTQNAAPAQEQPELTPENLQDLADDPEADVTDGVEATTETTEEINEPGTEPDVEL